MKNEKILNAIGGIDDDLVSDAVNDTRQAAKKKTVWKKWGSIAAVLALCLTAGLIGVGIGSRRSYTPQNSVVFLDVNPSVSLTVNADEKLISAEGLNADGRTILEGMDLTGVDMTVAINAIIGSMLQKGYLSDLQNAILVSVENEDAQMSAALQQRIASIIGNTGDNLDVTVLSQAINDTTDLEQLAQKYNISLGKAAFIQEVVAQDPTLTAEKLAPLSITEIALISQSKNITSDTVMQNGTASDKAYISRESVLETAYRYAGVSAEDVTAAKVEFDSDGGVMIYEVEFLTDAMKHECDIDARTGQVLSYESEKRFADVSGSQQPSGSQQASDSYIGEDAAKSAALADAGVTADTVSYLNCWIDYDDGRAEHYDVEFTVGQIQYEYEIDLYSGAILKRDMEDHNRYNTPVPNPNPDASGSQQPSSSYIGEDAAKSAALADAGVTADTVSYLNCWIDYDDGRPEHYEVEFTVGQVEYEYEIDLYSGAILKRDMEDHSHGHHGTTAPGPNQGSSDSAADIGAEAAKTAALNHAGLTASQVTKLKAEYDIEDGVAVYEVEFEYNRYEYEYEIDAATGAVLKYDIDD
ncbi:MAG: PepSY domain-containing protein [bacterium]|nr:PepSY domain-containing protein [bacterium]